MNKYTPHKNRAFTLVELLVVIAIIGILSSIVVTSLGNNKGKTRDALRKGDIKQIETALDLYFTEKYTYPSSLSDLETERYFEVLPKDPVTHVDYGYSFDSGTKKYCVGTNLEVITPTSQCSLSSYTHTVGN
jgi:prepilin-type N-terminal cleavage/methylation domain-containing protein